MLTSRRFMWLSFKARIWRRIAAVLELLWILPLAMRAAQKAIADFEVANAYGNELWKQEEVALAAERARRDEAMLELAKEKRLHADVLLRHARALVEHAEILEGEVAAANVQQRQG